MRVLVVRLSALGDVLTATPVATVLKRAVPDAELTWVVEERCADVLRGNPLIDHLIVLPTSRQWGKWLGSTRPHLAAREARRILRRLRRERFDAAIDLQGLFKSALLAGTARADRKIMPADAAERLPGLFTDIVPRVIDPTHIATMYTSLLAPLGIEVQRREDLRLTMPVSAEARERVAGWLSDHDRRAGAYVALIPGTTRPQKMWPTEYWPELAAKLDLPAVIVGGPGERELAGTILSASRSPVVSAAGEMSLPETAALLESAALTVAVDTGPMHMAVAVGCPTISLFGSTGPRLFDDGSRYVCLHRQFACWPCHRHPICEHYECLRAIRPEDVARVARDLVGEAVVQSG